MIDVPRLHLPLTRWSASGNSGAVHTGKVTLRHAGRLYHLGIGRAHARTHVIMLVQDLRIRIIDAATGELLRELTLDPARSYQATGNPRRPPKNK